jgi:hypothetical protein
LVALNMQRIAPQFNMTSQPLVAQHRPIPSLTHEAIHHVLNEALVSSNLNMSMREALIGTWRLVSYEAHDANGNISYPLGRNLQGFLCYTEEGFMSLQVMKADRPRYSSNDPHFSLMEEIVAAANGYVAYAGRFSVEEATGLVKHHIELSLSPIWVGTNQVRSATFKTGRLCLQGSFVEINGLSQAPHTVWEKVLS